MAKETKEEQETCFLELCSFVLLKTSWVILGLKKQAGKILRKVKLII